MTEQELENRLGQVELLQPLVYPALRRVVAQGRLVQVKDGQVVIGPRFGTRGFFVVIEGTVEVVLPFGPTIAFLGPGEVFGEMALMQGSERSAYCKAAEDSLVFEIPFATFHAEIAIVPAIRDALDALVAERRSAQTLARSSTVEPEPEAPAEVEEPIEGSSSPAAA